jgi:hypothetical protein
MDNAQATELIERLRAAYPQRDIPKASVEAYAARVTDLPAAETTAAIEHLIRTSDDFPSIAALRAEAQERVLNIPSVDDAYNEISAGIRHHGRYQPQPQWSSPFLRRIVAAHGGWTQMCQADVTRQEFRETYYRLRREAVAHAAPKHEAA